MSQEKIFQERKGRQLALERYEGDILVGSSDLTNLDTFSAALADQDKLWPSGVVEYRFWRTFPRFFYISHTKGKSRSILFFSVTKKQR